MNTTHQAPKNPKPTGRRYASVDALLQGEGFSPETQEKVRNLGEETRMTRVLAALRAKAGLTQSEMAEKLGKTQGYISKLESGTDEKITCGEIVAYARVLNEPIGFVAGPEPDHVSSIKSHAFAMKRHMMELANLASKDAQLENHIQEFFGEAFVNIFTQMAECQSKLPNGAKKMEFTIEVIQSCVAPQSSSSKATPTSVASSKQFAFA